MLHRRSGKPLGVRIETHEMIRGDALLFSESQSRIVVSRQRIKPGALARARASSIMCRCKRSARVGGTRLVIQPLLQLPVEELRGDLV